VNVFQRTVNQELNTTGSYLDRKANMACGLDRLTVQWPMIGNDHLLQRSTLPLSTSQKYFKMSTLILLHQIYEFVRHECCVCCIV